MKVSNVAAQQLLDELTKSKVVVTISTKVIKKVLRVRVNEGEPNEEILKSESKFWPYSISINNQFNSSYEESNGEIDQKYAPYMEGLRDNVLAEIDSNINLRNGEWEILNYLSNFEFELKEIRGKFKMDEFTWDEGDGEETVIQPDASFEKNLFPMYNNSNIEIEYNIIGEEKPEFRISDLYFVDYALCRYWDIQILIIERLIRLIEQRKSIIEKSDDYVQTINSLPTQLKLQWTKTDTDLLELIIALYGAGAIQNATKDLTQKEAIQVFSDLFSKEIKDEYKKLNAARNRKKEDPSFIIKMQKALEAYYQCLNEKN